MQAKVITTPLLFLLKINFSSRILLTGMLLSLLWFLIYYNAREYFFHPLYFIMPSLLIVLILTALPSLLAKRFGVSNNMDSNNSSSSSSNMLAGIDASNMQVEEVRLSQQGSDSSIESNASIMNGGEGAPVQQVAMDESMIQQIVDEKIASIASSVGDAVQKASDAINTVNAVKTDIENLKKGMKDLTEAFETTLVDFKAFQAEIANPLNFMRKYFDQLNIDALSDPTLPLQKSDINFNSNGDGKNNNDDTIDKGASDNSKSYNSNEQIHAKKKEEDVILTNNKDNNTTVDNIKETHDKADTNEASSKSILSLAHANGITLAMLMELMLTIGEFMKRFGNEYADILHVQCRLLNLNSEAEKIVYSIVDMLSKSTLTPEECAVSLYMLAEVLGFKDKDADTLYARLRMTIKSNQIGSKGVDDHEHR